MSEKSTKTLQNSVKEALKEALPAMAAKANPRIKNHQIRTKQDALRSINPFYLLENVTKPLDTNPTDLFNLSEAEHELTAHEAETLAQPGFNDAPRTDAQLTTEEILQHIFQPGYSRANTNLDQLFPQRVKVAWKLTRELGRQLGAIKPGESIIEFLMNEIDWQTPQAIRHHDRERTGPLCNALKFIQNEALELPLALQANQKPGLTIGPPPIPRMHIDTKTNSVRPNYDPIKKKDQDPLLYLYVEALEELAEFLNIYSTNFGHAGMIGLLNLNTVRLAWPGRKAIGAYEATIIKEVLYKIVKKSVHVARQYLQDEYDLPPQEVEGMISLAREHAREITAGNIEDDKGVMVLRLEDFLQRARGFGDWRAEMYALKQLSLVLGITRTEPEDAMKDIIDTVKKVSSARDVKMVMNEAAQHTRELPEAQPG